MNTYKLPSEFDQLEPVLLPKQTTVFSTGDKCQLFVFVVSGIIRVDLASESGSNLLLYRIKPNDTCVLTTSCLMSGDQYSAEATVEEDATVLTMPAAQFFASIEQSNQFRKFVFSSFSQRLTALMAKVDEIAFRSIEHRLASSLLHYGNAENTAVITHELLAADIGSAREVVSRKLSQWDSENLITRGRGEIHLLAIDRLKAIAKDGQRS